MRNNNNDENCEIIKLLIDYLTIIIRSSFFSSNNFFFEVANKKVFVFDFVLEDTEHLNKNSDRRGIRAIYATSV